MIPIGPTSMLSIVTFNTSPAFAPSIKMGPVAGLTKSQLMDSNWSSSFLTWFEKQSMVLILTLSPFFIRKTGSFFLENAKKWFLSDKDNTQSPRLYPLKRFQLEKGLRR